MTPFAQHALNARLAAQDHLIGLLLGIVVKAGAITAEELATLIGRSAKATEAGGGPQAAAYLRSRADVVRKAL